jgi:hypothetical protein
LDSVLSGAVDLRLRFVILWWRLEGLWAWGRGGRGERRNGGLEKIFGRIGFSAALLARLQGVLQPYRTVFGGGQGQL